ncbi:unnamed protein product [Penicillium salamii]|uniref:FHA domain-containing protein n=1 Tax=Penicillium salamii TaxID=1612424 RepID=A0A9W4N4G5_9EURO|nr:unnamed protein product [Penicillium salamii]CAG7990347.1 unnamed protein product [Penicillium salamii]CAG7998894.1 unnamed protein product [Penicillium salamii]CAG8076783.1 unnamed protein product [Penicillium salamii]CAG8251542.1 unnamed protein product [Penicillium salamii]
MAGSDDERHESRRRSVTSPSDHNRERRRRDAPYDDHHSSSRRRDDSHRSSRRVSPRRRSSRSPRERSDRSDRDRPRRERRDRSNSAGDDHRRHRHRSHRHRDTRYEDERRSSRRDRDDRPRSRSPRKSRSPPPRALERSGPLPSQSDAFTDVANPSDEPAPEKQKPNFNATGRLAAESNTVQVQGAPGGIVLKYHEPPEARKPPSKEAWRMYVFKGKDLLETVELGGRSCWLFGREHMVVDFPIEHPSCSKQHAVLQFRFVEKKNEFGDRIGKVKPYLLDIESANGSSVNGEAIPAGRYVEVMDKDVIRFGLSSREYVLMLPPS